MPVNGKNISVKLCAVFPSGCTVQLQGSCCVGCCVPQVAHEAIWTDKSEHVMTSRQSLSAAVCLS